MNWHIPLGNAHLRPFVAGLATGLTVGCALVAVFFSGCDGSLSYDDCILQHVKAGMNNAAVGLVKESCGKKFSRTQTRPTNEAPLHALDAAAIARLTGNGGPNYDGRFEGTLYNGNRSWKVLKLAVVLGTMEGGSKEFRTYAVQVEVPAQSARNFSFQFVQGDPKSTVDWSLRAAEGVLTNGPELTRSLEEIFGDRKGKAAPNATER